MAFRNVVRSAAAAAMQRGGIRYVLEPQSLAPCVSRSASSGLGSGFRQSSPAGAPLWAFASRMASTAQDFGRAADSGLLSVLKAELKHEREGYSQPKELTRGPPKPWTLTDRKGHMDVILRRSYGHEDIAVTCVYQSDPYGETPNGDEEDSGLSDDETASGGDGSCVNMTITISKGADNPALEISAASYGTEITIDHVLFQDETVSKEGRYDGPNFLQLDEEVQNQFEKFIRARGVNNELTSYLFALLTDKEQREYTSWLQRVESFLRL